MQKSQRKVQYKDYARRIWAKPMTPEEKQRLQAAAKDLASILYKNTSPEALETLEGIEKTVRAQMLEHVSPLIAFFYRTNHGYKQRTD